MSYRGGMHANEKRSSSSYVIRSRALLPLTASVFALAMALVTAAEQPPPPPGQSDGRPAIAPMAPQSTEAPVTFSKDVAPILYQNCTTCHRPGTTAPMSLLTYKDARPYAKAMRDHVLDGLMPPWHADPKIGSFANARMLTEAQRKTIVTWANTGSREGDPADLPPQPKYSDTWEIGTPDLVVSMQEEFEVPAEGVLEYQWFTAPVTLKEDRWIKAMEVRSTGTSVVHHVVVMEMAPQPIKRQPIVSVAPEFRTPPSRSTPPEGAGGGLLMLTASNTGPHMFREGTSRLLKAGSTITFQVHYTTNGKPTKDRTSIGFVFAKEPPKEEIRLSSFANGSFVIPPGAANHRIDAEITFVGRREAVVDRAAHASARQELRIHAAVSGWPQGGHPVGAALRLRVADGIRIRAAAARAEGHEAAGDRALRQFGNEPQQSGSESGSALGRSDLGGNDVHLGDVFGRRRAAAGDGSCASRSQSVSCGMRTLAFIDGDGVDGAGERLRVGHRQHQRSSACVDGADVAGGYQAAVRSAMRVVSCAGKRGEHGSARDLRAGASVDRGNPRRGARTPHAAATRAAGIDAGVDDHPLSPMERDVIVGWIDGGAPEGRAPAEADAGATPAATFWCRMHPEIRADRAGTCPLCGMDLAAFTPDLTRRYGWSVSRPSRTPKLTPKLTLRVTDAATGAAVRDFERVHEYPLHLFLVSEDFRDFQHVHPVMDAEGEWTMPWRAPKRGRYWVYGDFLPAGGAPQMLQRMIAIETSSQRVSDAHSDAPTTQSSLNATLSTSSATLRTGDEARITIALTDAASGKPVDDLQQYLGAWGHLFVLHEGRDEALHAHPDSAGTTAGGPAMAFDVLFPRAGTYHLWMQVQRRGAIVTLPFVVRVSPRA